MVDGPMSLPPKVKNVSFFDPKKEKEVLRQQKMAELLMKQGQTQLGKGNEVVDGIVVKKSPIEGLAGALQMGLGGMAQGRANQAEDEATAQRQRLYQEALSSTDPRQAAALLAQDPESLSTAAKMWGDALSADQAAALREAEYAREDANWQRDATFKKEMQDAELSQKREASALRAGQGGALIPQYNEDTGAYDMVPSNAPRKLSATEQKEFFDAEDIANSGPNLMAALEEAKKINQDAYSGWGADTRAFIASNVGNIVGAETPNADATVNLKNIVQSQALESLKSIFGGMPTEGERKILLEMQASTDKTPKQRAEILDRAMVMAKRRIDAAQSKKAGIASGDIYNVGQPQLPTQETLPPVAPLPADAIRAKLQGKMPPKRIEAYIKSKGL